MSFFIAFIFGALCAPLVPRDYFGSGLFLALTAVFSWATWLVLRVWRNSSSGFIQWFLLWTSALSLGAAVALWGVDNIVDSQIDESWHGRDIQLQGRVLKVIDRSDTAVRMLFQVENAKPQELAATLRHGQLRLSWYYGEPVEADQRWRFTVRLKRPRGFVNPRGFDYAAWLLSQDVVATGYVKNGEILDAPERSWGLRQLREQLAERLFARDGESIVFFRALLLGDTSGISADQWRILQRTGTIHLITISGLHVGLVAVLGFGIGWILAKLLALWLPSPMAYRFSRYVPLILSCGLALSYSALAGFSIPTQRALIAVALANLALMFGVQVGLLRSLVLACVMVLLTSPLAPTQAGFWLSFIAVLVLVLGFAGYQQRLPHVHALVKAQLLLTVGLLPPLLALGNTVSVTGMPANLIAVPVVSVLVVPGLILVAFTVFPFPALSGMIITGLDKLFGWVWAYLTLLSDWQWTQWWPNVAISSGMIVVLALGALFCLFPVGLNFRWLGMGIVLLALFAPRLPPPPLKVAILEVGQGLAVWVQTPDYVLVYDTGPKFSSEFDAGSRILAPFLRSQGVQKLDTLMVSHGDNDHSGGLAGLVREIPTEELLLGDPGGAKHWPSSRPCQQGQTWQRNKINFRVLWPPAGSHQRKSNN
mgnify:CR=1 FL=1